VGGITGPLLFGHLIGSGDRGLVGTAFLIGAAVMAIGRVVELAWGVTAEGQQLEDIAAPRAPSAASTATTAAGWAAAITSSALASTGSWAVT
jgi:hypothetical protein